MKLLTVDHCPIPGLTLDEQLWRARHFDICTAGVTDPVQIKAMREANPALKVYGYIQPTRDVSWTRYIRGLTEHEPVAVDPSNEVYRTAIAAGCACHVKDCGYDGLFIDEPFVHTCPWQDVMKMVVDIENAIAPKHCMINFGDAWTWRSWFASNPLASQLAMMMKEHFVQVATMIDHPVEWDAEDWQDVLDAALARCNGGKKVTLGIYCPGGEYSWLGALAYGAPRHPNLSWHYATAVPPEVGRPETQWCEWWSER